MEKFLTVREMAQRLQMTPQWVREHSGRNARRRPVLPCVHFGAQRFFDWDNVVAVLNAYETGGDELRRNA